MRTVGEIHANPSPQVEALAATIQASQAELQKLGDQLGAWDQYSLDAVNKEQRSPLQAAISEAIGSLAGFDQNQITVAIWKALEPMPNTERVEMINLLGDLASGMDSNGAVQELFVNALAPVRHNPQPNFTTLDALRSANTTTRVPAQTLESADPLLAATTATLGGTNFRPPVAPGVTPSGPVVTPVSGASGSGVDVIIGDGGNDLLPDFDQAEALARAKALPDGPKKDLILSILQAGAEVAFDALNALSESDLQALRAEQIALGDSVEGQALALWIGRRMLKKFAEDPRIEAFTSLEEFASLESFLSNDNLALYVYGSRSHASRVNNFFEGLLSQTPESIRLEDREQLQQQLGNLQQQVNTAAETGSFTGHADLESGKINLPTNVDAAFRGMGIGTTLADAIDRAEAEGEDPVTAAQGAVGGLFYQQIRDLAASRRQTSTDVGGQVRGVISNPGLAGVQSGLKGLQDGFSAFTSRVNIANPVALPFWRLLQPTQQQELQALLVGGDVDGFEQRALSYTQAVIQQEITEGNLNALQDRYPGMNENNPEHLQQVIRYMEATLPGYAWKTKWVEPYQQYLLQGSLVDLTQGRLDDFDTWLDKQPLTTGDQMQLFLQQLFFMIGMVRGDQAEPEKLANLKGDLEELKSTAEALEQAQQAFSQAQRNFKNLAELVPGLRIEGLKSETMMTESGEVSVVYDFEGFFDRSLPASGDTGYLPELEGLTEDLVDFTDEVFGKKDTSIMRNALKVGYSRTALTALAGILPEPDGTTETESADDKASEGTLVETDDFVIEGPDNSGVYRINGELLFLNGDSEELLAVIERARENADDRILSALADISFAGDRSAADLIQIHRSALRELMVFVQENPRALEGLKDENLSLEDWGVLVRLKANRRVEFLGSGVEFGFEIDGQSRFDYDEVKDLLRHETVLDEALSFEERMQQQYERIGQRILDPVEMFFANDNIIVEQDGELQIETRFLILFTDEKLDDFWQGVEPLDRDEINDLINFIGNGALSIERINEIGRDFVIKLKGNIYKSYSDLKQDIGREKDYISASAG